MLNFLIGNRSLNNIRTTGRRQAEQLYDPSTLDPQRQAAQRQASQGIDTDTMRQGALAQLNRQAVDTDIYGGSAGRGIGMMGQQNFAQGRNLANFEAQIGMADQQARMQGRNQLASIQGQQRQIGAQREGAKSEVDMMVEAEKSSRRFGLLGAGIGLASAFAPQIKGGALQLINLLSGNTSTPGMEELQESVSEGFESTIEQGNEFLRGQRQSTLPQFTARSSQEDNPIGYGLTDLILNFQRNLPEGARQEETTPTSSPTVAPTDIDRPNVPFNPSFDSIEPEPLDLSIEPNFPEEMMVQSPIGNQPSGMSIGPVMPWTNQEEYMNRRGGDFVLGITDEMQQDWRQAEGNPLFNLNPETAMARRVFGQNPPAPAENTNNSPSRPPAPVELTDFQEVQGVVNAIRDMTPEQMITFPEEFMEVIRREPAVLRSMPRDTRNALFQRFPELGELYETVRLF